MRFERVPKPIDTAPKDGGWILARVPKNEGGEWSRPWIILTFGDRGWVDDDGNGHEPVSWVPLPDPQPTPTGWTPPSGTIQVSEITGEGWTLNGKPIAVPWRWAVFVEKEDGTYDEYRDTFHSTELAAAQRRAVEWQDKLGLPIQITHLDHKVIPFRPASTRQ